MPYKRKSGYPRRRPKTRYNRNGASKSKYSRKRNAYKMKVKRGQTAVNFRTLGLPPTIISKLKWNHTGLLTPAGANQTIFAGFVMNAPRDPAGVTTDPPAYLAQLLNVNMYNKYTCYKATYRLRIYNESATGVEAQYLVWFGDQNDVGTLTSRATSNDLLYEEREQSTAYGGTLTQKGSTTALKTHTGTITPARVFGARKSKVYDDDQFSAEFNADPILRAQLMLGVAGAPSTTSLGVIRYEIQVIFHIKFWDLANTISTVGP